jgi:hypothetical protein
MAAKTPAVESDLDAEIAELFEGYLDGLEKAIGKIVTLNVVRAYLKSHIDEKAVPQLWGFSWVENRKVDVVTKARDIHEACLKFDVHYEKVRTVKYDIFTQSIEASIQRTLKFSGKTLTLQSIVKGIFDDMGFPERNDSPHIRLVKSID